MNGCRVASLKMYYVTTDGAVGSDSTGASSMLLFEAVELELDMRAFDLGSDDTMSR